MTSESDLPNDIHSQINEILGSNRDSDYEIAIEVTKIYRLRAKNEEDALLRLLKMPERPQPIETKMTIEISEESEDDSDLLDRFE